MIAKAYASVLSLMSVVDQILHHHNPRCISISYHNLQLFQSLYDTLTFLQGFLEVHSLDVNVTDGFLTRIADVVCAAEDVIESHIANHFYTRVKKQIMENIEQIFVEPLTYPPIAPLKENLQFILEKLTVLQPATFTSFIATHLKRMVDTMIGELQKLLLQLTNLSPDFPEVYSHDGVFEKMMQNLHIRITLLKKDFGSIDCQNIVYKLQHFSAGLAAYEAKGVIQSQTADLWKLMSEVKKLMEDHVKKPLKGVNKYLVDLNETVALLQNFLAFTGKVTYEAEDANGSPQIRGEDIFNQHLNKLMQEMDRIMKDAIKIKEKIGIPDLWRLESSIPADIERSRSKPRKINELEGFEDIISQVLDALTAQPKSSCQRISVAGMGGIGETTLATHAYGHPSVVGYFDARVWVTVSQTYDVRKILVEILSQSTKMKEGGKSNGELSGPELQKKIYRSLINRRYLLILDDVWGIEAWEQLQHSFPKQRNGSRVMITTRIATLGPQLDCQHIVNVHFLGEERSWNLLCKTVYKEKACPTELEEIGKGIAKKCKGLPLSLIVIGGLLANSKKNHNI